MPPDTSAVPPRPGDPGMPADEPRARGERAGRRTGTPAARFARMRLRLWPRSLAGRTALSLLVALAVVQALGLTIHALDRLDLQHLAQGRNIGVRVASVYRFVASTPPEQRAALVHGLNPGANLHATLDAAPALEGFVAPPPPQFQRLIRVNMALVPIPPDIAPRVILMRRDHERQRLLVALNLPDGSWLNLRVPETRPSPFHSPTFLTAFTVMTLAAAVLIFWAVRRLTAPVRTLAAAAEALGRDVNAPPLPEDGPSEVATAAAAFNTMAARIRRFVQDRTLLLAAIGHDLRTPITRLKLRAEFIEDEEQRGKILADLDELEAMLGASLAFARDATTTEPVVPLDLAVLLRTILDEAGDLHPELAERLSYEGPDHLTLRARPVALKRALSNLVTNAIKYGGGASVRLEIARDGEIAIMVEDNGPGIPPGELERIFEPFHRVEPSRNRETGGVGLGLPIARNILRAHGGDVTLRNRPGGGAVALVTLPG